MPGNSRNIDSFDLREYLDCFLIVIKSITCIWVRINKVSVLSWLNLEAM